MGEGWIKGPGIGKSPGDSSTNGAGADPSVASCSQVGVPCITLKQAQWIPLPTYSLKQTPVYPTYFSENLQSVLTNSVK